MEQEQVKRELSFCFSQSVGSFGGLAERSGARGNSNNLKKPARDSVVGFHRVMHSPHINVAGLFGAIVVVSC